MDAKQARLTQAYGHLSDLQLLHKLLQIYDQKHLSQILNQFSPGKWARETINRWQKGKISPTLSYHEYQHLLTYLPVPDVTAASAKFRFIDLFAGIGGIRKGFEQIGGFCVFTSEWNKFAQRTYKANYYSDPEQHQFNEDIRTVTLSQQSDVSEQQAYAHIDAHIPDHDVLLAGFPCQPFSLAGVSKKNSMGRAHGFECDTQGTLFFDVARILASKRPAAFVLENVKNLKSHDQGKTFRIIMDTLQELGYEVADSDVSGRTDPKVVDARHFLPQHRERIVLVGFRKDLNIHQDFSLTQLSHHYPSSATSLGELLDKSVDSKYILTPKLWQYLYTYAQKHRAKGNGFGYGLVTPNSVARTLSARYYKDGSEILVDRGWDMTQPFEQQLHADCRPRRLTPMECARLMGFAQPGDTDFVIPVSDTQAYRQFGNSVVVPVFRAVAQLMASRIYRAAGHVDIGETLE